jgi:Fis family transcriptional regulator
MRSSAGAGDAMARVLIPYVKEALEKKEKNIYEKVHAEVDRHVFQYLLSHTRENQSETARLLGINRLTLRKKLGLQQ